MTFARNVLISLKHDLRFAVFALIANVIAGSALIPRVLRIPLLRIAGLRVGRANVAPGVFFGSNRVEIGYMALVNHGCWFDAHGVKIGDHVEIGYKAMFVTAAHEIGPPHHRSGPGSSYPIVVEDGCWIGARATILPGVTVASGCVIGAGALVDKSTEPNGLYLGVPARRVRDLD